MSKRRPNALPGVSLALSLGAAAIFLLFPVAGCKPSAPTRSGPAAQEKPLEQPPAAQAHVEPHPPVQVVTAGPHFAVQVAAFAQRADAEALAARLSDLYGLQTLVAPVETDGGTQFRVRLLTETKEQAQNLADTFLRTQKLKVWIIPLS